MSEEQIKELSREESKGQRSVPALDDMGKEITNFYDWEYILPQIKNQFQSPNIRQKLVYSIY